MMTIVSRPVDAKTSADISDIPYTVGWTRAAIAVHSILQLSSPMFVRLTADRTPPLLIDFRHHAYAWQLRLDEFPTDPIAVDVETEPTTAEAPALFALPGRSLDGLLWVMGINSFAGMEASWMRPGDRYKLTRWPNLIEHAHTLTQMRMTAMLGNVFLNAQELATAAGTEISEAQRLINAFSLMGILQRSGEISAPAVVPASPETTEARGLFGRLRDRLGL